jgi:hypothetical protein
VEGFGGMGTVRFAGMLRRQVLAGGLAVGAAGAVRAEADETASWSQIGRLAFLYCLPLQEMAATRARALQGGVNRFRHSRVLSDAKSRDVTTPNSDTLYSSAWLDLTRPVTVSLPQAGQRYFSLALMDLYTNNFRVLGDRAREGFERAMIVGPGWRGAAPAGMGLIRAPTTAVWALGRTYCGGPADLEAARAVQGQLGLTADAAAPVQALAPAPARDDPTAVFQAANRAMAIDPPPARDAAALARMARIGVGPGLTYPAPGLTEAARRAVEAAALEALAGLRGLHETPVGGWVYPQSDLGDFGVDYPYRAAIALGGLAALPVREAVYLRGAGERDGLYDGAVAHRLRLRPAQYVRPDGFWSLSLYQQTPAGQLFFFDNPLNRYAIGANTPGLMAGPDGWVEIVVARQPPAAGAANWLPCPAGPYRLQFRAFRPTRALAAGRLRLGPVVRQD